MITIRRVASGRARVRTAPIVLLAMFACAAPAAAQTLQFTDARATGTVLRMVGGVPTPTAFERTLADTLGGQDTIPARAHLSFAWHADPVPPATAIVAYVVERRFPLQPFEDDTLGADVTSWSFDVASDVQGPGGASVRVLAIDDLGGTQAALRRFTVDFAPDTWWAGVDPAAFPVVPGSGGQRYLTVGDWNTLPNLVGSLFGCDSLTRRPALRAERRTFLELYGDRIYLRSEGDTVHMNAWVVLHNGGFDPDSRYAVRVSPFTPIPDTAACAGSGTPWVVRPDAANGSPIGFRARVITQTDGPRVVPAETFTYPVFDWNSVFHAPTIAMVWPMTLSGRAYALVRAEDGDGIVDGRVVSAVDLVEHVEQGTATPQELALRSKVLTYYVNKSPALEFATPAFYPKPPAFQNGEIATAPSRVVTFRWFASNPDPYDNTVTWRPVGGRTISEKLRYTTTITGRAADGSLVRYTAPAVISGTSAVQTLDLTQVTPAIVSPDVTVHVQLCDCAVCDGFPGSGRCVEADIPLRFEGTAGAPIAPMPLALEGFRPNPATDEAVIAFTLPDARGAALDVFDTSGRRVWSRRGLATPGPQTLRVERALPAGVYLLRLEHGGAVRTARAAIVR